MRYWILLLIFISFEANGQNLIPNPYFDYVLDCESRSPQNFFLDWYNPTKGYRNSPHHPCLSNVPDSPYGVGHHKYPKKGEGMISILLLSDQAKEFKSYIATPFSQPLRRNIPYLVRFYISPRREQNSVRNMVADVVGMYFSSQKISKDILTTLPYTPQVEHSGFFFEDYDKWYLIQGKYIAEGHEKYAIIGNFRKDKMSRFKYMNPSSGSFPNGASVFIDDVLVEAFDPLPDTLILCEGQSTNLNAGFHDATYQWNTGERDSVITVSRSGNYKVRAMIDTLIFEDSTRVIYMKDFADHMTIDTFFCEGSELILRSPVPGSYHWSDGHDGSALTILETGTFHLKVENTCGTYQFTYEVAEKDCECELILPTAFSPNGDHRNKIFSVIDQCRFREWNVRSFQVYDKWGGMVYQESGQKVGWNGQSEKGEDLPPGVYAYRLVATVREGLEEETVVKTGTVHLLR